MQPIPTLSCFNNQICIKLSLMHKFKTSILLLLFSTIFTIHSNAQYWGRNTFGQFTNEAVDVEIDANGNSYIAGYLTGETAFQTGLVILNGYSGDAYVAKYNSAGTLIWVKTFGGNFSDRATDLAIGSDGNIVFTGQFFGTATFGAIALTTPMNSKDIFVAKLDPTGTVIWAFREGGIDAENAYGVTVDNQNNVILTGQFKGASNIAGQNVNSAIDPLTGLASFDFFVSKYDENGLPLWVRNGFADYEDRGLAVSVDDQDNIFMTGQFSDTLQFCGNTYYNMAYNLGFVTKLSPIGDLQYFNIIRAGMTMPSDVKVDDENNVVIAGDFLGNMNYQDQNGLHPITNPYSKQGFLIKTENNGAYIWNYTIGSDNPFSLKSIAIDENEDIYSTGWFECTLSQTHDTITHLWNSVGHRDPYLLKVNRDGVHDYIKQFGGHLDDEGHGVAILSGNHPVVCGMFKQDLAVPMNSVAAPVYSAGSNNSTLHYEPISEPFFFFNGDKSANSFLLNAVDGNSEEYNYFIDYFNGIYPVSDSLEGRIWPDLDTMHLCIPEYIGWGSQTFAMSGPAYNYLWNTGDSSYSISVGLTGEYSVYVERIDECLFDRDTIFVQMEEIPPLPFLTDDHLVNDSTISYLDLAFCNPETIEFYFDSLPPGVDFYFSTNNGTIPSDTNNFGPFIDSVSTVFYIVTKNQYCFNGDDFQLILENPITYDSIVLGIAMNSPTFANDSIEICLGERIDFIGIDYITNPNGNFQAIQEPFIDFYYNINNEHDYIESYEYYSTTGWKYLELDLILGYQNLCGIDTTHYHATDSFYVKVNPLPTFNTVLSGDNLLCPNGSVFITTLNTHPNLSWNPTNAIVWTSVNGDSIEVSQPGNYTYSGYVVDSITNCDKYFSFSYSILFKQPPLIDSDPEDGIICPNDSVLFTLPTNYTNYIWIGPNNDTLSTTNSCYGSDMGSYYCHLVDLEGCPLTTLPAQLLEYSTPSIFVYPDPFICPGEEVTIGVSYSGDPNFIWHPTGETTDEIIVSQAGIYSVQIQQCGVTVQDTIEIFDGSFTVTISVNDSILCANEQAVILGNMFTGTYEWNNGQVTGPSYQTDQTGNYFAEVTNEFGCIAQSNTIHVQQVANSSAPLIDDVNICPGNSAQLVSTSLSYWYSMDSVLLDTALNFVIPNVLIDTSFLLAYVQAECPIIYTEVLVSVIDTMYSSPILMDTILCSNQGLTASVVSNTSSFEWFMNGNFVGTTNPITLTPLQINGGGSLVVQLNNSCVQMSLSDSVFVFPFTLISSPFDTVSSCINDSVLLFIDQSFATLNWEWTGNTSLVDSLLISVQAIPIIVSVSALDLNGCQTNELEIVVQSLSNFPTINLPDVSVCLGEDAIITAPSLLNWYSGDSVLISQNTSVTLQNVQNDTTIYYSDPSNSCSLVLQELEIDINGNLIFDEIVGDSVLCMNEVAQFTLTSNASSIEWFLDGLNVGQGSNLMFYNAFSPFTGQLIAVLSNSCQIDTVEFDLTLQPQPQISVNIDSLISCAFAENQFYLNEEMSEINWVGSFGTQTTDTLNFISSNSQESFTVSALDSNGCLSNELVVFVYPSTVYFDFSYSTATNCLNDTLIFEVNTSADTFSIQSPFGIVDTTLFGITLSNATAGNYILWVQDDMGCEYLDTLTIQPYQIPTFDLGSDTIACLNDIYTYYFPSDTNSYSWTTYGGSTQIPLNNSQDLILTATSPQGCVFSDSLFVQTVNCDDIIPNFITANNDGTNDYFFIDDALAYPNCRLEIKNRYGVQVFKVDGYQNNWSGEDCVEGVYFFMFYPNPKVDPLNFKSGFIQLFK